MGAKMRKLLFVMLSCAFLAIQGFAYEFNTNTKYGKLQHKCLTEKNAIKSCQAVVDGCKAKRIGNACEAQYSLGIAFITNAMFNNGDTENAMFGLSLAKEAYKIGCKELKHKNTCEIDKNFFEKVMNQLPPETRSEVEQIKQTIHGEYDN